MSKKQKLVIVRGLPGAGKSTYCDKTFIQDNYRILEPDHLMCDVNGKYTYIEQLWGMALDFTFKQADFLLSIGHSVVVCGVFIREEDLVPYRELANYYDIDMEVKTIVGKYKNIHNVPFFVYRTMKDAFDEIPG